MNGGTPHYALAAGDQLAILDPRRPRGDRRCLLHHPDDGTPQTGIGFVIDVDRVFGMEP